MSRRKRNHSAARQRLHLVKRPARLNGAASPLESNSEPIFATSGRSQPDACLDDRPAAEHLVSDEPPGVALRRAREAAGLSLDALSAQPKLANRRLSQSNPVTCCDFRPRFTPAALSNRMRLRWDFLRIEPPTTTSIGSIRRPLIRCPWPMLSSRLRITRTGILQPVAAAFSFGPAIRRAYSVA